MDAGIPNRSYPCGVRALLQVQRETHRVVKRERALLLVHREGHLVVKRETVASISPSPPQNPSLKKPRRPEATLLLSTPLHTADPLVPLVSSTSYTKTMQQYSIWNVTWKIEKHQVGNSTKKMGGRKIGIPLKG